MRIKITNIIWILVGVLGAAPGLGCTRATQTHEQKEEPAQPAPEAARPGPAPAPITGPPPRIVQIAAGRAHTCVLTEHGTVRCWGDGKHGRLGYANTESIGDDEPASAGGDINLGGHAIQIVAGSQHTCALLRGGTVRCWGDGEFGQLGHGNTDNIGDDEPPAAAGDVPIGAPVSQIAAGGYHNCALLESGDIRCWGRGRANQLGYGGLTPLDIGNEKTPADQGNVELGAKAVQLALSLAGTCAVLESREVRCWGAQSVEPDDEEQPPEATKVPALLRNAVIGKPVKQLVAGEEHHCALLDSGAVRCFGFCSYGALGYPGVININLYEGFKKHGDVQVGGKVVKLAAGGNRTCAIIEGGTVRCWGQGHLGQLGYGSTRKVGDLEPPAAAGDVDVGGPVVDIAAGGFHTCALLESGALRCWGAGGDGQLGYGNTQDIGDDEPPAAAGDVPVF